jgi:hypothetical protein
MNDAEVEYPIGTVAYYGPNGDTTTKIVAAVINQADAEPILQRWMGSDILENQKVKDEIDDFFERHQVTQIGGLPFNIGCPHEEGEDFPTGEDCPFCSYWKGKQGEDRWEQLMESQLGPDGDDGDWDDDEADDALPY